MKPKEAIMDSVRPVWHDLTLYKLAHMIIVTICGI